VTRGRTVARTVAAALFLAVLGAGSARSALFDDEEARKRIDATNQRLGQVQKQLEDRIGALETQLKNQGLVDLSNQIELLKADAARLRGQIEVLNHQQDEAQKRQRDLYVDLDSRLRKLEAGSGATVAPAPSGAASGGVPPSASAPVPAPGPPVAPPSSLAPPAGAPPAPAVAGAGGRGAALATDLTAEQRSYDAALDLFKAGTYDPAIAGVTAFVKTYPRSPLAPSAQYWIGNAQFARKDFRAAIAAQRQLIAAYPDSQKVPDALLNIATSQFELGDGAAARRTLEGIVAKYPQTDAANKARQRLAIR